MSREERASASRVLLRAAALSIASNTLLVAVKTAAGLATGALSVLGEALHSGSDLLAAVIAFGAVRAASRPADGRHPFGHGKYESLSATIEGVILLVGAAWIVVEAIARLGGPQKPHIVAAPGVAVMLLGVILNTVLSSYLLRAAKKHDSPALKADGVHLRADVWTSGAVLVGLVVIHFGGPHETDAILALLVAGVVCVEGIILVGSGSADLLDVALPPAELAVVERVLADTKGFYIDYHKLRTRRAGRGRQADVHIEVCQQLTVGEAHEISQRLEKAVAEALPGTDLVVHIEPCDSVECLERLKQGLPVQCKRLEDSRRPVNVHDEAMDDD